jgi:hypothetical protein
MINYKSDRLVYLALYKLIKYLYSSIRNFPKEYKYSLGQEILTLAWKTLDFVMIANTLENRDKHRYIIKAITTFSCLKFRLRLSCDLKILSHKKYSYIIKQTSEINKMLNGWLAWSKRF